jgi:antitoxin ChpS
MEAITNGDHGMITVNIRKQGGAAVITIPSDVLKLLNIDIGATLALELTENGLVVRPVQPMRKRYTLAELLEGIMPEDVKTLHQETQWFLETDAKDRDKK